jgi:outer membrane biosynthesis protein TonB
MGWFLPWTLLAIVVVTGIWLAADALAPDDIDPHSSVVAASPSPRTTPAATPSDKTSVAPKKIKKKSQEPKAGPKPDKRKPKPTPKSTPDNALITEGITVQALNATGFSGAATKMGERLEGLGYDVLSVESANKEYQRTAVFWSYPSAQEAAERLARKYGWDSGPKPPNLSDSVALHVIVGNDEL